MAIHRGVPVSRPFKISTYPCVGNFREAWAGTFSFEVPVALVRVDTSLQPTVSSDPFLTETGESSFSTYAETRVPTTQRARKRCRYITHLELRSNIQRENYCSFFILIMNLPIDMIQNKQGKLFENVRVQTSM